jgi:hypothetical protein
MAACVGNLAKPAVLASDSPQWQHGCVACDGAMRHNGPPHGQREAAMRAAAHQHTHRSCGRNQGAIRQPDRLGERAGVTTQLPQHFAASQAPHPRHPVPAARQQLAAVP